MKNYFNQQQAVIEKFALCEETLTQFLKWITEIENKIASVGGPRERIDELRNQINLLKVKKLKIIYNLKLILKYFNSKSRKTSTLINAQCHHVSSKFVKLF